MLSQKKSADSNIRQMTGSSFFLNEIIKWVEERGLNNRLSSLDGLEKDPWRLLVAIVLGLQTTDEAVSKVLPELWKEFPSHSSVIFKKVPQLLRTNKIPPKLEEILQPLGLAHRRALTVVAISNHFEDCGAPTEMLELVEIKGVGTKTANLYRDILLDEPTIAVDTHVFRVCTRIGYRARYAREMEEELMTQPINIIKKINSHLTAFGRQICKAKKPWCDVCPVHEDCPSSLFEK